MAEPTDVEPEPAPAGDLLEELLKVHRPHRIYTECEHPSGLADDYSTSEAHDGKTPVLVDEIGWTCEDGLMYVICQECCMDGGEYQTEECADNHTHTLDPKDRCLTALIIARHSA